MKKILIPILLLAASCTKRVDQPQPLPTDRTLTFAAPATVAIDAPVNLHLDTTGAVIGTTVTITAGPHDVAGIDASQPGVVVYIIPGPSLTITYVGQEFGHYAFRITQ